jgi:hypothetical protein
MSHGYAVGNLLSGLAAGAFTKWGVGAISGADGYNDGLQDRLVSTGAAVDPTRIVVDLGSARTVAAVAVLSHNMSQYLLPTFQVEAASDAGFTTTYVNCRSGPLPLTGPGTKDFVAQFPPVSRRYWRLSFQDTTPVAVTVSIGELLFMGSVVTLPRLKTYGWGESERYIMNRVESRTGNIRSTLLAGPIRSKTWPFVDQQGITQREALMSMWRACHGGNENLLWLESVDSSSGTWAANSPGIECLWGKLQTSMGWKENDFNLFDVDALSLTGLGRAVGT